MRHIGKIAIYGITGLFVLWAAVYIYRSSFIAIDGNRYFSLLDDPMISMRFAWNLSHGYGLVWNPGERVEGYTNLLMTLLMSLSTWLLDKRAAVLAVQLAGIPTLLVIAWLTKGVAREIFHDEPARDLIETSAYVGVLLYFPLSYWTLMGMETGLVTLFVLAGLLFAFRWTRGGRDGNLYLAALASGLAFLTRNDSLIYAALVFGYLILQTLSVRRDRGALLKIGLAIGLYGLFVAGQTVFRLLYYGTLLPNTYVLKIGGVPLSVRLNDGTVYVFGFLRESLLLILFALMAAGFRRQRETWFLLMFPFAAMAYSIWTGGDSWPRWRFIAPAIPATLLLGCLGGILAGRKLHAWLRFKPSRQMDPGRTAWPAWMASVLLLAIAVSVDLPYLSDIFPRGGLADAQENQRHMNQAIAIENLTTPQASIGVFWAGLIPYYTGRPTVDFLGKSDRYIASLPPHLPDKIIWLRSIVQPGHDKYDLAYSIKQLQPVYIQRLNWVNESVGKWGTDNYVRLTYQGRLGTQTILVKKDSPDVLWDRGTIIPWPGG